MSDRAGVRIEQDYQWHICTGSYKDSYGDNYRGWETEKGMPPAESGGGVWMRLHLEKHSKEGRTRYALVPQFTMA